MFSVILRNKVDLVLELWTDVTKLRGYTDSEMPSTMSIKGEYITKTCPCNIQRFLKFKKKMKIFSRKKCYWGIYITG